LVTERITISDVARAAGVSKQTVSRVLNDKGELAPDTRARVLSVIRELGYRPNVAARSLLTGRTFTLGLVIPDLRNPFCIDIASGVHAAAQQAEYHVLLYDTSESPELEAQSVRLLHERRVDGVILCSSRLPDSRLATLIQGIGPVVLVNRWASGLDVTQIGSDYVDGMALATRHLIDLGHRRIGMVTLASETVNAEAKLRGYQQAMAQAGLPLSPDLVAHGANSIEGGVLAADRLLDQPDRPTAIVSYGDAMAIGVLHACHRRGLTVPDDVAVIGFGGSEITGFLNPPLSTIMIENCAMGYQAVRLLLDRVGAPDVPSARIRTEPRLIARASTVATAQRPAAPGER
jgi:LacI family transcriptional regulator